MGWFWADTLPSASSADTARRRRASAAPPPGCPMHEKNEASVTTGSESKVHACPYPASRSSPRPSNGSRSTTRATLDKLNPLNYMPSNLSQSRAQHQRIALPTDRTLSSIPKGDTEGNWEYPSPQQMYNAMLRKGYTDTPEDAVESMVAVHNFLNEGAWAEIIEWERRFAGGLAQGWQECSRGEQSSHPGVEVGVNHADVHPPRLSRFMGRPNDMTPKASMLQLLGWISPGSFGGEAPFDRHDWYVVRQKPNGDATEVRYVIDYYSGPPEPTGEPVFYLDVRPAIDRPTAAVERMMRWGGDIWWRASGGTMRESRA